MKSGTDFREFTVLTIYPGQGAELSPVRVSPSRGVQHSSERTDIPSPFSVAECREGAVKVPHQLAPLQASSDAAGVSIMIRKPNECVERKSEVASRGSPCQPPSTCTRREAATGRPTARSQADTEVVCAARRGRNESGFSPVSGAPLGPAVVEGKVSGGGTKTAAVSSSRSPGSPQSPLLSPESGPGTPSPTLRSLSPASVSEEVARREREGSSDLYSGKPGGRLVGADQ